MASLALAGPGTALADSGLPGLAGVTEAPPATAPVVEVVEQTAETVAPVVDAATTTVDQAAQTVTTTVDETAAPILETVAPALESTQQVGESLRPDPAPISVEAPPVNELVDTPAPETAQPSGVRVAQEARTGAADVVPAAVRRSRQSGPSGRVVTVKRELPPVAAPRVLGGTPRYGVAPPAGTERAAFQSPDPVPPAPSGPLTAFTSSFASAGGAAFTALLAALAAAILLAAPGPGRRLRLRPAPRPQPIFALSLERPG